VKKGRGGKKFLTDEYYIDNYLGGKREISLLRGNFMNNSRTLNRKKGKEKLKVLRNSTWKEKKKK